MNALIAVLSLIIFGALLLWGLQHYYQVQLKKLRALGIERVKQLKNLISTLQRHRGQSFNVIKGNQDLIQPLQQTNKDVQFLFSQLLELGNEPSLHSAWHQLFNDWLSLNKNNLNLTPADCIEKHSELILHLLHLIEDLVELHSLQREIQPLLLILQTSEWIGQARAQGSSMLLSDNPSSVEHIRMSFLQAKLIDSLSVIDKCIDDTEGLTKLRSLIDVIGQQLLSDQPASLTAKQYFELVSQTIEYFMALFDTRIHS